MNIPAPFTRDEINLMLQEPFSLNRRIPGLLQEQIGKRMAAEVPKRFKKGAAQWAVMDLDAAEYAGEVIPGAYKAALRNVQRYDADRNEWAQTILPMHHQGMKCHEIQQATGKSRGFVCRLLRERGIEPTFSERSYDRPKKDYSQYFAQAHAMRREGMTWQEIGHQLGISKMRIREAYNDWKAAQ